jgi:hypothetical protein
MPVRGEARARSPRRLGDGAGRSAILGHLGPGIIGRKRIAVRRIQTHFYSA